MRVCMYVVLLINVLNLSLLLAQFLLVADKFCKQFDTLMISNGIPKRLIL